MFAIFEKIESQALFAIFEHHACELAYAQPPALGIGPHPPLDPADHHRPIRFGAKTPGSAAEAGLLKMDKQLLHRG